MNKLKHQDDFILAIRRIRNIDLSEFESDYVPRLIKTCWMFEYNLFVAGHDMAIEKLSKACAGPNCKKKVSLLGGGLCKTCLEKYV